MPRSRLFRSIVVFGAALGGGAGLVTTTSTGCSLYIAPDPGRGWGVIDAGFSTIADAGGCGDYDGGCVDAHWGFIDAPLVFPDGGGTIADAPNDAGHT